MSTYSLSFAQLESAAQEMRTISSQIENFLQELQTGTLRAITEWSSGARNEFDAQRDLWRNGADDMVQQAIAAQAALGHITVEYGNGEDFGIKIWSQGPGQF